MKSLAGVILICLTAFNAHAASFDCTKAATFIEKAICSDRQLSELDEVLMQSYKKALQSAAGSYSLKSDQKSWLTDVRNKCQDSACLKRVYNERITTLNRMSAGPAYPAGGVTGVYKSKTAELRVQQISVDGIKFLILATWKTHTGEASGEASLKGDTAVYVDREEDCGLVFKFSPGKASIRQDGACSMGLNVTASGEYRLVDGKPPMFDD